MRGACGIDIDKDKTFISFAGLHKSRFNFFEESKVEVPFRDNDFLEFLKGNSEVLNARIREKEKKYSLKVEKIYLNLPWGMDNISVVEEIVPLKRRKKLDFNDLTFAKRYLEDIFLDWNDFCIHHFISEYQVEGKTYKQFPAGVFGKKVKLKSVLFTIKDKLHIESESIIDNLDRILGGILSSAVSALYTSVENINVESAIVIFSISYACTHIIIVDNGSIRVEDKFDFGVDKIIQQIEKNFSFSFPLAEEIFYRYVSFKEVSYSKEVSIKNGDAYLKLSTQTLNIFVENYIKNEVRDILSQIEKKIPKKNFKVYFTGRFNDKEGFYGLFRDILSFPVETPSHKESVSLSLGCLKYGLFRPWENDFNRGDKSFFQRIMDVYRDYF